MNIYIIYYLIYIHIIHITIADLTQYIECNTPLGISGTYGDNYVTIHLGGKIVHLYIIDGLHFGANIHLYGVQICIVHMYVHNCGYMLCVLCWFRQKLTHMAVHDWLKERNCGGGGGCGTDTVLYIFGTRVATTERTDM